ncbi:hypothetical protein CPB86DRAFT_708269 [Serendipita vermifera]|nr:hypothetical protein CPB86DRAFT_708269 [Serendipita vermifera]
MQHSPNRLTTKKANKQAVANKSRQYSAQHVSSSLLSDQLRNHLYGGVHDGRRTHSILHSFPYETLCHITSYLDPQSLVQLSMVDKYFKEYASNDLVWKLALFTNVLDIRPEYETKSTRAFLLRRLEKTWKLEYIKRHQALSLWTQSDTRYIAHQPLLIPVPNIHMLQDEEHLMVAPEHFSWIFRTQPAKGKVLKGTFQPTLQNQAHPLNDWNPPSAGTMTSEGSLAKMAWGSQAGGVMVKAATKAIEPHANRRALACRSGMDDGHDGWINHIAWATNTGPAQYLITAGEDGRVKIWNAENAALVWTSRRPDNGAPFVRAAFDQTSRTAVALTETGEVFAWSPIPLQSADVNTEPRTLNGRLPSEDLMRRMYNPTTTLLFDYSSSKPCVFVHANEDINMWRFGLDFDKESFEMTRVENSLGHVTASYLHQPSRTYETPILMTGTSLCQLSLYSLGPDSIHQVVEKQDGNIQCMSPNITFTTHEDGAITSLATNNIVLLVGTARGIISVWDMVTLRTVRTIDASELVKGGPGAIKIICKMEQMVASVGRSVVHWKTGMLPTKGHKMAKKGKSIMPRTRSRADDYHKAILDSQAELEMTSKRPRPGVSNEHEQRVALETLGLDEVGAVEYALMVSYEEALQADAERLAHEEVTSVADDDSAATESVLSASDSPPNTVRSSRSNHSVREEYMPSSPWKTTSLSRLSPPSSTGKVQVSPPYRPEALMVGPSSPINSPIADYVRSSHASLHGSSKASNGSASGSEKNVALEKEDFPRISPTGTPKGHSRSSTRHSKATSPSPRLLNSSTSTVKPPVQPRPKPATAWSTIVKSSTPSPALSEAASPSISAKIGSWARQASSRPEPSRRQATGSSSLLSDEEAQLQFVLELSLAEAMSRGDA